MTRTDLLLFIAAALACALQSCSPSINFTSTTKKRQPKPAGSRIIIFSDQDSLPKGSVILGTVSVKDAGLSIKCSLPEVMTAAQLRALENGADAIKIMKVSPPDFWSTCWGVEALAVALDKADTTEMAASDYSANTDFLSFSGATCQDYGTIPVAQARSGQIIPLPFLCRTKYPDKIEKMTYAVTTSGIDDYFTSGLKSKYRCVDFKNVDTTRWKNLREFYSDVPNRAAEGTGSPLDWGHPLPAGIADSSTILYFPIAIERESANTVQGRFYILLLDAHGDVLFSRCMPYRPDKWSSEIQAFKDDVHGKLPLLEDK